MRKISDFYTCSGCCLGQISVETKFGIGVLFFWSTIVDNWKNCITGRIGKMVEFRCGKMKMDSNGTTVRPDPRKVCFLSTTATANKQKLR
jgi:hypothetical protein